MLSLRQMWVIMKKDIVLEMRTKEMIVSMLLFVMLTMLIFNFAFSADKNDLTTFGGGLLWLAFIYTSLLGLNRSFVHEKDEGCLDGLLLSPVDRSVIFAAKMLGNLIFITAVELAAVPVFTVFFIRYPYYVHAANFGPFLLGLLLSNIAIASVGTVVATMAVNTKRRELLMPLLMLPLLAPAIQHTVGISTATMGGALTAKAIEDIPVSMKFMAAYDIVIFATIYLLYDFVLGE